MHNFGILLRRKRESIVPSKDTASHTYRIKDINLIVLLLYPKADLYSLDGRLPINLIVGLVFLVGKTSNLRPGNLRSVTFQLIESWKLEAGC
jgi:hypothetical protein